MQTVGVSLAIRCHQDRSNGGNAGWIDWHNLLPVRFLTRGQVQLENLGGHFADPINIDGPPILIPTDRQVSRFQTLHDSRIASSRRVKVALFIGTDTDNLLAIRRNRKRRGVDALGGNRCWFSFYNILGIEPHSVSRFVARESKALSIRKPARPLVVDGIVGQRFGFTRPGGQKPELLGRPRGLNDDPLLVGGECVSNSFAKSDGW